MEGAFVPVRPMAELGLDSRRSSPLAALSRPRLRGGSDGARIMNLDLEGWVQVLAPLTCHLTVCIK